MKPNFIYVTGAVAALAIAVIASVIYFVEQAPVKPRCGTAQATTLPR